MSLNVQNSSKKIYQNNENRRLTSYVFFILNVLLRETGHSDTQKITFQALFTYLSRYPEQFLTLSYDFLRLQLIRLDKRIKEADLPELPSNRLIKDRLTSLFDLHLSLGLSFFEERSQLNGVPLLRLLPHTDQILNLAYQHPNFHKSPYEILEQVACQYAQDLLKNAKPIPKEEIDEKKRKSLDEYIDSLIDQFLSSSPDSDQYQEAESSLSKLRTNFQLAINQSQKAIERNQKRLDQIAQARYSDSVARHYSFNSYSPSSDSQKRRNTGGGISTFSTDGRSEILSKNSPNSVGNRSEIFVENHTQNEGKIDSSVEAVPYGRPYSENIRVSSEVIEEIVSYSDKKNDAWEKSSKSTPMTTPQKLTENTFQKREKKWWKFLKKWG